MSKKNCRKYARLLHVVGSSVAQKRKERGMSQDKLAEACGRSRNCIQQIECFEHIPSLDTILIISYILEFDMTETLQIYINAMQAICLDLQEGRKESSNTYVQLSPIRNVEYKRETQNIRNHR